MAFFISARTGGYGFWWETPFSLFKVRMHWHPNVFVALYLIKRVFWL